MPIDPETSLRQHGFSVLSDDLRFLVETFASALRGLGEANLARRLPWLSAETEGGQSHARDRKLGQAYSTAFQLLNIVEERTAARVRRMRETKEGATAERGLWANQLRRMAQAGLSEGQILELLRSIQVEPVLTAHPTEAKRGTARERHREIYDLMNRRDNTDYTPREQVRLQSQLSLQLDGLWRTGEIHVTRPTVEEELQSAAYYLREVFPETLARVHAHLREAWVAEGFTPNALDDLPPMVTFGNWIGGDRDGHPFVTAEVTAKALEYLRHNALRVHRRSLEKIAYQLPLSVLFQKEPASLQALQSSLVSSLRGQPGVDVDYILNRNREEPWRGAAYLLRARILLSMEHPNASGAYRSPDEFLTDVDALGTALEDSGAGALRREWILPLKRQLRAFPPSRARCPTKFRISRESRGATTSGSGRARWGKFRRMARNATPDAAGSRTGASPPIPRSWHERRARGRYGASLP
jgi:phosphoenolpyruvate carboxylase